MKIINAIVIVFCYLPYTYLLLFYSYIIRASIELGRMPTYENPDPKQLGFDLHRQSVYDSFEVVFYSAFITGLSMGGLYLSGKLNIKKIHITIFVIGVAWCFVDVIVNPFNQWFLD